jgi:proteasome lid subunit RPN8/RPN11
MDISAELVDQIVAHALEDPKNEVCGLVAVKPSDKDGEPTRAVRVHRAINKHASPLKFEIDGKEQLVLERTIEEAGCEIGGLYHSHVRTEPYPSQTDINFSHLWPDVEWIIVGLANDQSPKVRSYLIKDGEVEEVAIIGPVA